MIKVITITCDNNNNSQHLETFQAGEVALFDGGDVVVAEVPGINSKHKVSGLVEWTDLINVCLKPIVRCLEVAGK